MLDSANAFAAFHIIIRASDVDLNTELEATKQKDSPVNYRIISTASSHISEETCKFSTNAIQTHQYRTPPSNNGYLDGSPPRDNPALHV
jgi:flagellar basal body rod protein FlgB